MAFASPRRLPVLALYALSLAVVFPAGEARADRLVLADGRVVEGTVLLDGEQYRVASRFGESSVPVKDVKEWVKAKPVEVEWRERAGALKADDHAGRAALAKWLKDAGRVEEASGIAEQVIAVDPENTVAHEVLGHIRHKGTWMSPDDAHRADGLVERGGKWFTPEEWAALDAASREKAEAADKATASRAVTRKVNEAVRLMLAPDKELRAEGRRRLEALATETKSEAIRGLIPQVAAYSDAADALAAAARGEGSATVLTECRIQLARLKRPIQTFSTSLGGNISSAPVSIQLPELEVISVNTTVPIPAAVR